MLKELSKDLDSIKKIQSEMKDTLIEIKNNLQGNNRRFDEAENQINDLEQRKQKIANQNKKKKELKKNKDSVSSLWDNFKYPNICKIEVPEGKEKKQEIGIYLKK